MQAHDIVNYIHDGEMIEITKNNDVVQVSQQWRTHKWVLYSLYMCHIMNKKIFRFEFNSADIDKYVNILQNCLKFDVFINI